MTEYETMLDEAKRLSKGRATAGLFTMYKDGAFINGYRPKVGGQWVTLGGADEPELYSKSDAIKAAKRYKEKCKRFVEDCTK